MAGRSAIVRVEGQLDMVSASWGGRTTALQLLPINKDSGSQLHNAEQHEKEQHGQLGRVMPGRETLRREEATARIR